VSLECFSAETYEHPAHYLVSAFGTLFGDPMFVCESIIVCIQPDSTENCGSKHTIACHAQTESTSQADYAGHPQ